MNRIMKTVKGFSNCWNDVFRTLGCFGGKGRRKPQHVLYTGLPLGSQTIMAGCCHRVTEAYIVSLPASVLGVSKEKVAKKILVAPSEGVLIRCLGCSRLGKKEKIKEAN